MLDNQKKLIWLAALAVLGALLFIFYILTSVSGEPNKKTAQESAKFTGVFEDKDKKSAVRQDFYSGREDVITPAIEAFMEAVSSTFNQSAQNFSNESSQASSKPSMAQTFSSPSLAVTVTEQEVFEFGYNSEYINVLKDTNKEMIDSGFLFSGAVYQITNMAEAIALQDKYADYLEYLMVGIEGGGLTKDMENAKGATVKNAKGETVKEISVGGGWIGGKAFFRYYACPIDWCPLLNDETVSENIGVKDKTGLRTITLAQKMKEEGKTIQDSIVLSMACQCISGIELNLMRIRIIMEQWNKCLNLALQNKEYVARRLDGRTIDDVKYNLSNDAKKFSFHQGSEMVIDNVFVYGKMFKTYD